jgi:integrase
MPTLRFTARKIAALKPAQVGQVDYWDASLPGFGLRASRTRMVWTLCYRLKAKEVRKRRMSLGQYPALPLAEARAKAIEHLHRVALGEDPAAEAVAARPREEDTVQALFSEYAGRSQGKRSWPEERRIFEKYVLPVFGRTLVRDLTRRDIRNLVEAKADKAPVMANRLLARLTRLLNFAVERDWIDANPAYRLPKPGAETSRNRVLTTAELTELWSALGETIATDEQGRPRVGDDGQPVPRLPATFNDAFRVLLLTGQRLGEVTRMRWADVDLEKAWWTIPGSDTKNGDDHRVPLTASVLEILTERRTEANAKAERQKEKPSRPKVAPVFVFANGRGTRSIAARARKAASHLSRGLSFSFRAHDLRRTAASGMAEAGVRREYIAHVLNHRSVTKSTVTAIYDRYAYDREKRQALETWARTLGRIAADKDRQANVVSFGA